MNFKQAKPLLNYERRLPGKSQLAEQVSVSVAELKI
jgi:hypothetical protein